MGECIFCGSQYSEEIYRHYNYCPNCNIAFRDELFIADEEKRKMLCSEEWIEKHSEDKDIDSKADNLVKEIKNIIKKGNVLDVGCGSGVLVDKLVKNGYRAAGIDWSEQAISFADKNMSGTFMVGDADLSCIKRNNYFDVVVASHILEHLEYPVPFIEGVKRVLVDDGCLIVAVPNLDWYVPYSFLRSNPGSIFDEDHTVCYSPRGLLKILNQYGFNDVNITTRTHNTILLTILAVNIYQKLKGSINKRAVPFTGTAKASRSKVSVIFERVSNNPVARWIENPFNRISERNYKGMELIATGRIVK